MNKRESKPFSSESIRKLIKWATIPMLGAISLTGCGGSHETYSAPTSTPKPAAAQPVVPSAAPTIIPENQLVNQCMDIPTSWSTNFHFPPVYTYNAEAEKNLSDIYQGVANAPNPKTYLPATSNSAEMTAADMSVELYGPGTELLNGPGGNVIYTLPKNEMLLLDCPIEGALSDPQGQQFSASYVFQIQNSPNPNQWYWIDNSSLSNNANLNVQTSYLWQNLVNENIIEKTVDGTAFFGVVESNNGKYYFDTEYYNGPPVQVGVGTIEQYNPTYFSNQTP